MSGHQVIPVLVAGAGPTGLAIALTLVLNGVNVRIIKKEDEFFVRQRGAGIQPRTLEVYKFLGVLPDVLKQAIPVPLIAAYNPGEREPAQTLSLAPEVDPTPSIPYPNSRMLAQSSAEAILRAHLEKHGVRVELATELSTFEQHEGYVTARLIKRVNGEEVTETVNCHWLVGADGARGVTRKLLGLTFLGESLEVAVVTGEVYVQGISQNLLHIWRNPAGQMTLLRGTEQEGVFQFILSGKDMDCNAICADDKKVFESIKEVSGRHDLFGKIIGKDVYQPKVRMVNKFGEGRVFVAGDAAHVHHPSGGQGMNSSVQDAFNLGWKLALVEKGVAAASLLDTYNEERLPVIKHMLQTTTGLFNKMSAMTSGGDLVEGLHRGSELKQLGVNYRWSSIVVDERAKSSSDTQQALDVYGLAQGQEVRAGDRAPDAPGLLDVSGSYTQPTTLFDIFNPAYHTALVFASAHSQITPFLETLDEYPQDLIRRVLVYPRDSDESAAAGFNLAFKDEAGHAYAGYNIVENKPTVVIVRPDGVVGAIVFGRDGLQKYLRIFSAC